MREYTLIRSDRKSLGLQIKDGEIIVRAPRRLAKTYIDSFVEKKEPWIAEHLARQEARRAAHPEPGEAEKRKMIDAARNILPAKIQYFGAKMGLFPTSVQITGARKRFGSCSSIGKICFSWRLMGYPEEAIDYVVVHELAHLRHMNHGREFYSLIERFLPDWRQRREMLKK